MHIFWISPSLVLVLSTPALWPCLRIIQTQPVSSCIPGECYPTFLLLSFLSFHLLPPPSYLFTAGRLLLIIVLQRIWVGFVSARFGLYIELPVLNHVLTNTHSDKHPLRCCESVSGGGAAHTCRTNMCHTCLDYGVTIIGLNSYVTCVENVCVTFHLAWKTPSGERERAQKGDRKRRHEKNKSVPFTKVRLFIGCRLTEKKDRKSVKKGSKLTDCECENGVGWSSALCIFTHSHWLLCCCCVSVCQIKTVTFEWGTLTGVKAYVSTLSSGHTHTLSYSLSHTCTHTKVWVLKISGK